jgi:hypothetical protein
MYGVTYDQENSTLSLDKHDCGLLSNASVTFKSLLSIHKDASRLVKILWPYTSAWNKPDRLSRNVYDLYFTTVNSDIKTGQDIYFNAMIGDCNKFDFSALKPIRDTYFNLSSEVIARQESFIQKYHIDFDRTIAILYRGTDKILEVPRVHPKYYLNPISPIKDISNYRVLIQTDQQQALDYFNHELPNSFHIEEMPLTKTDQVMHNLQRDTRMSNYDLGVNYLAAIAILSKCKYVVYDTNNAGLWICILRGDINNMCQIHASVNTMNRFEY